MKCIAVAFIFLSAIVCAAQDGYLHPAKADLKALDLKLLPKNSSSVEIEPKQVFVLQALKQYDLLLVPVHFFHDEPSPIGGAALRDRCGLFVVSSIGTQNFVFTVKGTEDWAVSQCSGLSAMRRKPHDGPRPELTLTYATFDPPRAEDQHSVTLRWDDSRSTYVVASTH